MKKYLELFVKSMCQSAVIALGTMATVVAIDKGIETYQNFKEKREEMKNDDNEEYETGTF